MRRFVQLTVIVYVAVYAIGLKKGYQEFREGEYSVAVKVKGTAIVGNGTDSCQ
jgi:hypothetical protein